MFFIGIFRIYPEEKKVAEVTIEHHPEYSHGVRADLIRQNQVFDFFFIPVFRYHKNYYLKIIGTSRYFSVSSEKAEKIIKGKDSVSYYDLEEVQTEEYYCPSCSSRLDDNYKFCPFCGDQR